MPVMTSFSLNEDDVIRQTRGRESEDDGNRMVKDLLMFSVLSLLHRISLGLSSSRITLEKKLSGRTQRDMQLQPSQVTQQSEDLR